MRWFLMLFTCPGRAALVLGCVSCCPCRNAASTELSEQAAAKATAVTAAGVRKSLESLLGGVLRCWWQAEGNGLQEPQQRSPTRGGALGGDGQAPCHQQGWISGRVFAEQGSSAFCYLRARGSLWGFLLASASPESL